jgi:hypothetical protein
MPRKKRISRQRLGYHSGHVFQLCVGHDFFGDAFGDDFKAMKAAWPILKSQVMEMWAKRGRTGQPWGCRFDKKTNAQNG